MPTLIRSILYAEPLATVVVVDDGSGPGYQDVFDDVKALGCHVIGYTHNGGKGFALKAGFGFFAGSLPGHDVVCADSDGQHRPEDILRVAGILQDITSGSNPVVDYTPPANANCHGSPAPMVLGSRSFTGKVPARNRFGNSVTKALFTLATGELIPDTQTGPRLSCRK